MSAAVHGFLLEMFGASVSSPEAVLAPWQRESLARGRQKGAVLVGPAPLALSAPAGQMIFTHLPKTGGLTLRSVLAAICWANTWTWEECLGSPTAAPDGAFANYRARGAQRLAAARLIWGHLPFGVQAGASSMTLLRDPVARELSTYAMGASRGAFALGTKVGALHADGTLLDNMQCRMLAGDPALLQPGSVCTREVFDRARENLLTGCALAGDVARFNDFVAVLLAALRSPAVLFFRRNIRAVDLPPAVIDDITRDTQGRAAYDIALYALIKGKVRVALKPMEGDVTPPPGCLAFKDELAGKVIYHPTGSADVVAYLAQQGIEVRYHAYEDAGVEWC